MEGYLHIVIGPSGNPDAPVRVVYEIVTTPPQGRNLYKSLSDGLSLSDEWFSPVKIINSQKLGKAAYTTDVTIKRPNPGSTAGTMVAIGQGHTADEQAINAHTIPKYGMLDLVTRQPFDKQKTLDFAEFNWTLWEAMDCTLSYAGEEDVKIKGQKRKLHKFVVTESLSGNKRETYWVTEGHEIVQADLSSYVLVPASETEARMPVAQWEADNLGAKENAALMSRGVSACGMVCSVMGLYFQQNNAYPTLDGVTGDKLLEALHIAPDVLDDKYFNPSSFTVTSTPKGYKVKAVMSEQTYVVDDKGVESGTYRTGK